MKKIFFLLFLSLLSFAETKDVLVIRLAKIRGTIDPATASYLKQSIWEAEKEQAQALLVELDTPGGLLTSVREMAQTIDASKVPVIVYVTPAGASATSAGALLMLSSHLSAMAPGTNIGAAHPVGPQGEDVKGAMGDKIVNDTAAFAKGLAELRGRNRDLAEKVVSKSKSLTAEEALKEKFIEIIASTREDLLKQVNGYKVKTVDGTKFIQTDGAQINESQMTLGQRLLHYLANPNIAAVLMTLGMLLIYVEISNPGITIAGILGAICLLIAFIAFQTLPVRVGGLALLLLGLVLLLLEPFVTSKGALAAGGVLSFILGLLWVMDPDRSELKMHWAVILPSGLGLGTGVFLIGWAAARTVGLTRRAREKIGGGGPAGLLGYTGRVESIEDSGRKGTVLIRGEIWEFSSDENLKVGDEVNVLEVQNLKAKVRRP